MHYFTLDGDVLTRHDVQEFPAELETMYHWIRTKHTISYYISDWEDDMTTPGGRLNYNNSYGFDREPSRNELVFQNGLFFGFYIGDNFQNPDPRHILSESNPFIHIEDKDRLACYRRWELLVEPDPALSEYIFLARVCRPEKTHLFTIDEFPDGIAESISDSFFLEDRTGLFSGVFCVTLKLRHGVVNDPDVVLEKLQTYQPVLVRR